MTACDEPYIGEESIIRPPARKNARMTAAHSSRSSGSSPTLKVIQLPSPTTGSCSPLEGIGRVIGACLRERGEGTKQGCGGAGGHGTDHRAAGRAHG